MNKDILDQLSFGFEIEGSFKAGSWEKLGFKGEFVHDGSVSNSEAGFAHELIPLTRPDSCTECVFNSDHELVEYCRTHHARYNSEGSPAQEYSSAVFQTLEECLKTMKFFNKKSHEWNETCGLHFHVGTKDSNKYKQLFGVTSNFQYLKQLLTEAKGYCEHQNARLNSEWMQQYFKFFTNKSDLIKSTSDKNDGLIRRSGNKYRFVRFHPEYNTLEFRFLVPCEHKVNNIQKLLQSLTAYLGRDQKTKFYTLAETEPIKNEDQSLEFDLINYEKENIDIVKQSGKNDYYKSSQHFQDGARFANLVSQYGEEEANRVINSEREGNDLIGYVPYNQFTPFEPLVMGVSEGQTRFYNPDHEWERFVQTHRTERSQDLLDARTRVLERGEIVTEANLNTSLARITLYSSGVGFGGSIIRGI